MAINKKLLQKSFILYKHIFISYLIKEFFEWFLFVVIVTKYLLLYQKKKKKMLSLGDTKYS